MVLRDRIGGLSYTTEQFPFKDGWGGRPGVANQEHFHKTYGLTRV